MIIKQIETRKKNARKMHTSHQTTSLVIPDLHNHGVSLQMFSENWELHRLVDTISFITEYPFPRD